jgi:hypothetical protein
MENGFVAKIVRRIAKVAGLRAMQANLNSVEFGYTPNSAPRIPHSAFLLIAIAAFAPRRYHSAA